MKLIFIDLICVTIIIWLTGTTLMGSFKKIRFIATILLLTILPLVLCFISINFIYSSLVIISSPSNYLKILGMAVFCVLISIIYLCLVVGINIFPDSKVNSTKNDETLVRLSRIDKALKVTTVGIYFMIINIMYALLIGYLVYITRKSLDFILLVYFHGISALPGAALITYPFAAYVATILTSVIVILILVNYVFIVNGTIRLIIASEIIRKNAVVYLLLTLIPIVSLFSSLVLYNKAKGLLKSENYKVGIFGVKI